MVSRESPVDRKLLVTIRRLLGFGVLCFSGLVGFVHWYLVLPTDRTFKQWGELGDFFGGILNPVFGLLGFSVILLALYYQKRELSLATEEFRQAREVAKDSERISRLHAQLTAISHILEIKRTQAEEAKSMHNTIASDKLKAGRQVKGPYDDHYFNLHMHLTYEVRHYADRVESLLEALGGAPAPTASLRAEEKKKLYEELDRIAARTTPP